MGTLSGLFDLSRDALSANQAALNATANNVSNQNTAGYTRQIASFSAGDVVTINGRQTGTGPTVATSSVRDRILEQRLQQQLQQQSSTGARSDALTQIQDVFNIGGSSTSAGSTQIGTALDSFSSSLTALSGSPAEITTRQRVFDAAAVLASAFNSAATQFTQVQTGLNSEISNSVSAVNGLTSSIAKLNQRLAGLSPNVDAGALEDERQLAIEQLSQYVGLDQIKTENNGITLTTQGGAALVLGSTAYALRASRTSAGTTAVEDSAGADVTSGTQGGSIGGQLMAQSVDLPAATSAVDALAYRIATVVNRQNQAGFTPAGAAGAAIFTVPSSATGAAATISVIAVSSSAIASSAPGEGSSGGGNALALSDLAQGTDSSATTLSDSLAAMLAQTGSTASAVSEQNTTEQATLTQLKTQRDSTSAVSLDSEAANLSQYEKSYQAAAQVLTVIDRLMATAMNIGTSVAVS